MTYREAVSWGEKTLKESGISEAKTDAWRLMETACKMDRSYYFLHEAEDMLQEEWEEYESVLKKRAERIPLQYITGEQEFMGLKFLVNSSVLIPRQDTETLAEEAIRLLKPGRSILDLCTGSGCLIVSILKNVKDVEGTASDSSKLALNVAKENAKRNGVLPFFICSDLFERIDTTFDVIVSNPPYIRTKDIPDLMPEVRDFEPVEALDGKEDGLYFYRKITAEAKKYLNEGGALLFEIGCDQAADVTKLMKEAGFGEIGVVKDLAGLDRVVIGKE